MRFNKLMSTLSIILLVVFLGSVTTFAISMNHTTRDSGYQSLADFWRHGVEIDNNRIFEVLEPIDASQKVIINETKIFELHDNIEINCSLEDIIYICEERDDISIHLYHEKPVDNSYKLNYSLSADDDTIRIHSTIDLLFPHNTSQYKKVITIRVPIEYTCDYYELCKNIGNIDSGSIPEKANTINLKIDTGETNIELQKPIEQLIINSNAGAINVTAHGAINYVDLNSDLGQVIGTFYERVESLDANVDAGDIQLTFHNNTDSKAYVNVDLGNVNCEMDQVSHSNDADIKVNADLGSIKIKSF